MKNPWLNIKLEDYESHMRLKSIYQLQTLNKIMKDQFSRYNAKTLMLFGAAGGNGLEHASAEKYNKIYAIDVNESYLIKCSEKYSYFEDKLVTICADLSDPEITLPGSELLVADLLIEYIGCRKFAEAVRKVSPLYVSVVIQHDLAGEFVSSSPYTHSFDGLVKIHSLVNEMELRKELAAAGYSESFKEIHSLPNKKELIRLDYIKTDA